MGMQLPRRKNREWLVTLAYRLTRLGSFLPLKSRFGLYLDLEWIFNRLAHEASFRYYSVAEHPFRRQTLRFLARHLTPTMTLIDIGCSTGDLAAAVAEKTAKVVGIDHELPKIEIARQRHRHANLEFVHEDAFAYLERHSQVDPPQAPFDVLTLTHVLEHLDQPEEFLRKFTGFFNSVFVEVPDFDSSYNNPYRKNLGRSLIYADSDHIWEFDRNELRDLLDRCGLRILDEEYRFGVMRYWCSTAPETTKKITKETRLQGDKT